MRFCYHLAVSDAAPAVLAVYFGPKAPQGKEEPNWVQTALGQIWNTLPRPYDPLEPLFDKTWQPGEIRPI